MRTACGRPAGRRPLGIHRRQAILDRSVTGRNARGIKLVDRLERERQAFSRLIQTALFDTLAPTKILEIHVIVPEFQLFEPGHAIADLVEYYCDRDQWPDFYILPDWVNKGVIRGTEWRWDTDALLARPPRPRRVLQRLDTSADHVDSQLTWDDPTLPPAFERAAIERISDLLIDHCVFELGDARQVAAFVAAQPESLRDAIGRRCAERLQSASSAHKAGPNAPRRVWSRFGSVDRDAINRGQRRPWGTKETSGSAMPIIYANYGYDIHQIEVDHATFGKIRRGECVSVDGQGFLYDEEGVLADHWVFNSAPGEIQIVLENGAEFCARQPHVGE